MATAEIQSHTAWTAADLVERFGPIELRRIRQDPPPGQATEQDVVDIHDREDRLFELVDGVLLEKTMGVQESFLAGWILELLASFVRSHNLGIVLGADGMSRLQPGLVRIPDVCFIGWDRLPGRKVPTLAMLPCAPHLAVEVLSPSNTRREMERKLVEYFDTGVLLVWYVDPRSRTVSVFTNPADTLSLDESQTLDGGQVLPGFELPVAKLFAPLESAGG